MHSRMALDSDVSVMKDCILLVANMELDILSELCDVGS